MNEGEGFRVLLGKQRNLLENINKPTIAGMLMKQTKEEEGSMNKQKKIEAKVIEFVTFLLDAIPPKEAREECIVNATQRFLTYLDSEGMVLKVEDWLPIRSGMVCTIEPLVGGSE